MGSQKPFSDHKEYFTAGKEAKICMLINAVYFFLESVFIVIAEDHCRLVIIHNHKLIVDQCYDSLRGAKIAFYRMYKNKGCIPGVNNEWSSSYVPDKKWLLQKLNTHPQPMFQPQIVETDSLMAENY